MRIHKSFYAVLVIALMAVFAAPNLGFAASAKAARLLEAANKTAIEAQNEKSKIEQGRKFDDALKAYQNVVKADDKSVEAAEALLATGKILSGVSIDATPQQAQKPRFSNKVMRPYWLVSTKEAPLQNDYQARDTFKTILQRFDKPRAEIMDDYGTGEGQKLIGVVTQAKAYLDVISTRMDETNKHKTLYKIMDGLVRLTGKKAGFSYWFAIILLAFIVKILITPLTKAQFKSMKEMQRIQPLIKEIQEKHKGDQAEIGKRTMDLYKEHNINPLMGCLPLLLQFPILYLVYGIIRDYEIQFAHGRFLWVGWKPAEYLWTLHLPFGGKPVYFSAPNLSQPDLILLVLYTISMILSQKISIVDPTQAEQQKMMAIMMPIMFFVLIGWLPSAFVLYWLIFNVLQTWQQYHIIHGGNAQPAVAEAAPASPAGGQTRGARRRRRRR